MYSGLVDHFGAIAGRMAYVFAVALLVSASVAHSQVIEEGGFPVKGGGVSGEPFSLSCPPRLYVAAGESVLFSCSATAVPEEGVRYAWEAVSGDGLRLLSDAQALDPLFTAPLSETREEYGYRLTAMSAGFYRTATVAVSVGGFVREGQEAFQAPAEECGSFGGFGRDQEGCQPWEKAPSPDSFGDVPEEEGIVPWPSFPEAPGAEDKEFAGSSGAGPFPQAPPRLECPVAVFLEELETGAIECRAWDASGEEYLEYSWEPVGSTTRDYLENPRLMPEDSPNPSVVAPEAPAYETLESFRSVEPTFRYRYRLTATSRATGLSSSSEVEVFVSSSRPGVYCPLEVEVAEGESIALDCEGVDPLSSRMDYDEDGASIEWEWGGLWGASTALLDATDRSSPLFTAPAGSAGEEYHYIASMTSSSSGLPRTARRRVTVRVVGEEDVSGPTDAPYIECPDDYFELYEGEALTVICRRDFNTSTHYITTVVHISVDSSPGATFYWFGASSDPIIRLRLAWFRGDEVISHAPQVDEDTEYIFTIRICPESIADPCSASAAVASDAFTVIILDGTRLAVTCNDPDPVYEGAADFTLDCSVTNEPSGATYSWTGADIANRLSSTNILKPTFDVPDDVDADTDYDYTVTLSASGIDDVTEDVTVTVLNRGAPSVVCADPGSVYEGSADILFDCSASGVSSGTGYAYSWTARGNTQDTSLLSAVDISSPTFHVPYAVDEDETYEYLLTVSSASAEAATAEVTVTVLNRGALAVVCADPGSVYEGSADVAFDCEASGVSSGTGYAYSWTARGNTQDTSLLSAVDISSPTFHVPYAVDEDETYEYRLTVSAANAESSSARVTVTVLNKSALSVACADPGSVYEGSADILFDCSASGVSSGTGYAYSWTARGNTQDTSLLSAVDISSPTFHVPYAVDEDETYEYRLTVSAANAESSSARVTVTVLNKGALAPVCADISPEVYEGSADFTLDCEASGAPGDDPQYAYAWTARGDTPNTDLLSATDMASPTFQVPEEVDEDETYEYLLTVSAANAEDAAAAVTVTVLNKGALAVICADPGSVYEGSADVAFDCEASGAPAGSAYEYAWTARGDTPNTDLLSATDMASPTFHVPEEVDEDETYEYLLTVSAENAEDAAAAVTVTVLNKGALALVCADISPEVYEGSEDIELDCEASGAPAGSAYEYVWTARGDTPNTDLLSATDMASPAFAAPEEVDEDETYEYLLTVSAENAKDAAAAVTVTVLNKGALTVVCVDPGSVYEGSEDVTFDCSASGAPGDNPEYAYAWTARGDTPNTDLLSATDMASPTFHVPEEVDEDETYEYLLTVSAENAEDASAAVTVTVLNKGALAVVCTDPGSVYEGSADFTLDCEASGAPGDNPEYTYVWTPRGSTSDTSLLSSVDISSPTFHVPEEVDEDETYEYLLTVSAANAEDAAAAVTVTVLNKGALALVCADISPEVYEGSEDIELDCEASGAPAGSAYEYVWTARGDTPNTDLLSATDMASPTFAAPEEVDEDETYEYLLTVSAANAEDASAEVSVTVLNKGALALVCADISPEVYEGSEDIELDCEASGAPAGSAYEYVWTARGDTQDTALLSATDMASPTFAVPEEVDEDETYEYLLTVSAANAEDAAAAVTVTVLNKGALAVVCTDPGSVYEGSADFTLDCEASGAPGDNPEYTYVWTPRGSTSDTSLLSSVDISSPTFHVPEEVDEDETYEYLLTVSAANAEDAAAEVTVTVLNKGALAAVCADPGSVYEGSADFTLDCEASGAPGDNPEYAYAWTARGSTTDTSLLSAVDIVSPVFFVPDEVDEDETYEYLLTVSAANAEDAAAEVAVTVLDRAVAPPSDPVSPPLASSSSTRESAQPSALGVTVSTSSLRFGVQSADTQASLDPVTDQLSTRVSGPYHAGRMTLSPGGGEATRENGEMDLSIELASPVVLRREAGVEAASIVLAPLWSLSESCEQLSSQAIGSLYTEVTLSDAGCRLLRFGGELDLTGVPSGRYAGSMDVILRSSGSEETHTVAVDVTVIPAQQVITIGPGGVRFSTSRELPAGLTEEQNLSIYPHVAFLTGEKPHGVFELSNPSLIPLEISVSARFGYTEATENGREVVVEDASGSHLGDLSQVVDIHPNVLVLQPGEKGLVRYGVQEGALAAVAEKGYAAFFDVVSEPRQYVRSDQMPEEVLGDRTARVTMRVPGVYVPGEGASQLRAALSSISYVGSMSATFLLETADHPFVGEVVAYDGDGRELGRRETLVYTRSRVRIPLDRMPEEGAVFLRFAPWGSGRVPEPASVEWDAPRRDIGAADKDRTRIPETLVQRP